MADYDLTGLGPRSFEHLIQALILKEWGIETLIFGDGPDGGREATYDGSRSSAATPPLNTYSVVQAKFRQRPEGSRKDADWLLAQVRQELDAYVTNESRISPQYYLLVTNVVLSPVARTGSKDKLTELVAHYSQKLGLLAYDIWDYDKLCRLLDGHSDIRRAYAALITPGDVLSTIMHQLDRAAPEFEDTLASFMQRELLSDQYANLEQAGHAAEERIPIARVFVDLPVTDRRDVQSELPREVHADDTPEGFAAAIVELSAQAFHPGPLGDPKSPDGKQGRVVLLGGPGQGKATLGQFICQIFRAAILKDRSATTLVDEARSVISQVRQQCEEEGIDHPVARRFPIRIALNDFARALAGSDQTRVTSVMTYIVERVRTRVDRTVHVADLRQWLRAYPWLVVLDGLDEVPASSNRNAVLTAIRDFLVEGAEAHANLLVVATSRPQGYGHDFSPDHFRHVWLAPLNPEHALKYARRLARVRFVEDEDRRDKVLARLARASRHPATARLMRTPLQVTIMATLVDRRGQPPQERWNLFHEYYEVIYQREEERQIPAAVVLREQKPNIHAIHTRVALLLQVESERTGQTDALLSYDTLADIVEARLLEEGHAGYRLAELKRQIIDAARDRLVFLVSPEDTKIGFEVRSLQEFMAAEGLMVGSDEDICARLTAIAPVSNWRNVCLFAAGKCFADRQHLRDRIYALVAAMNDDLADPITHLTLAGSHLALDLLLDGTVRTQPRYAQMLATLALRLLDTPMSDRHKQLAEAYIPELQALYIEQLDSRLATDGDPEITQAAWLCILSLTRLRTQWPKEMATRRWPQDIGAQARVIRTAMQVPGESWVGRRLPEVLPNISPTSVAITDPEGPDTAPTSWTKGAPSWLISALKLLEPSYPWNRKGAIHMPLLPGPGTMVTLYVNSIRMSSEDNRQLLKDMPSGHGDWLPQVANAEFLLSPSSDSLAAAILTATAKGISGRPAFSRTPISWPLAACLSAIVDGLDAERLISHVRRGQLGDPEDWLTAERRWQQAGVTEADIIAAASHAPFPFGRDIAQVGFPVFGGRWLLSADTPNAQTTLDRLIARQRGLPAGPVANEFATWVTEMVSFAGHLSARTRHISDQNSYLRMVIDYTRSNSYLNGEVLRPLDFSALDAVGISLLDELGHTPRLYPPFRPPKKFHAELTAVWKRNRDRLGILRLLAVSLMTMVEESPVFKTRIPLPNPSDVRDPEDRQATLLITVYQQLSTHPNINELAQAVAAATTPDDDLFISYICRAVRHSDRRTDFLVRLHQALTITGSGRWEVISTLTDELRSRQSMLDEPDVWRRLGLPAAMITHLPRQ